MCTLQTIYTIWLNVQVFGFNYFQDQEVLCSSTHATESIFCVSSIPSLKPCLHLLVSVSLLRTLELSDSHDGYDVDHEYLLKRLGFVAHAFSPLATCLQIYL